MNGVKCGQDTFAETQKLYQELSEAWKLVDAYKQDAKRYQTLCANLDSTEFLADIYNTCGDDTPTKEELDAAIDDWNNK